MINKSECNDTSTRNCLSNDDTLFVRGDLAV